MNLSLTASIIWAAGFAEHLILLCVLVFRGRWRLFPIFTSFIGFNAVRTILLFIAYQYGSAARYNQIYWTASCLDLALQIGVVYELARVALRPAGAWVKEARVRFILFGIAGAAIAAAIAYIIHPVFSNSLDSWIEKGTLFSAMLNVELCACLLVVSTQLGLFPTSYVMLLAQGWAVWSTVDLLAEAAYSHFGASWHGVALDYLRTFTYLFVTIYWIISLWRPEPERRTLSPDMQAYLNNLHQQLQSELSHVKKVEKH